MACRSARLALNLVFRHAIDGRIDVVGLWIDQVHRRSPPVDATLGESENELLNRALYQPTIAVDQSPPTFTSVAEILGKAVGPARVALRAETTRDPVTVVAAGGALIALSVSRTVLSGAAQGLSDRTQGTSLRMGTAKDGVNRESEILAEVQS